MLLKFINKLETKIINLKVEQSIRHKIEIENFVRKFNQENDTELNSYDEVLAFLDKRLASLNKASGFNFDLMKKYE
jgi:hypothetical protein